VSLLSAYDIAECLHDGDGSAVYRARRRTDGQAVVVKVSKGHSASSRQLTRFRNEYDLLESMGCGFGQGYLMARPMSYGDTSRWLLEDPSPVRTGRTAA